MEIHKDNHGAQIIHKKIMAHNKFMVLANTEIHIANTQFKIHGKYTNMKYTIQY